MVVSITILKVGFIGVTTLIEAILDERASRKDITVYSVSSGSKMELENIQKIEEISSLIKTDLFILVTPNASLREPRELAERLSRNKPTIIVSDTPTKKITEEIKDKIGYIIVEADSMIGVRKEFLDPVEMTIFNSDVIKVLSVTGAFRAIHLEIDRVIDEIALEKEVKSPSLVIDKDVAINASGISNSYARAKAIASYEAAKRVASLSINGSYKEKDRTKHLILVEAAHELMREAAKLADEAREIEKCNDSVFRRVHESNGSQKTKRGLMDTLS